MTQSPVDAHVPPSRGFRAALLATLCVLSLWVTPAGAQVVYAGRLGTQPIQLIGYFYGDGAVRAAYFYDKYDTPIQVNGHLSGSVLELIEKDRSGKDAAALKFAEFAASMQQVSGEWVRLDGSKRLPITLTRQFDIEVGDDLESEPRALLQADATTEHYFKLVIVKQRDQYYPRVSAVRVYQKGTDALVQSLDVDVELRGIEGIGTGDFNFDGLEDFSLFEASYAGPNTSSVYYLRVPDEPLYVRANFSGTSLEFDAGAKRVYEHNQCCGGRSHINATYKVVDNELVLIERTCMEYDEKNEDYVDTECD